MQGAALVVRQVITFIVGHEFDHRALGQVGRFVENKPALLDPGQKTAHAPTLRHSGCGVDPGSFMLECGT